MPAVIRDEAFQPDFHDILGQDTRACSPCLVNIQTDLSLKSEEALDKKTWNQGEGPIAF